MAILRQVTLKQSGKGQITLNDHELPSGDYAYSLLINGNTVDIKLMLITIKYKGDFTTVQLHLLQPQDY